MRGEDLHDSFCLFGGRLPQPGWGRVGRRGPFFLPFHHLQIKTSSRPAVLTKDLCMVFKAREATLSGFLSIHNLLSTASLKTAGGWVPIATCHCCVSLASSLSALQALRLSLFFVFRNCVTGLYEMSLYEMADAGHPGKVCLSVLLSGFPLPAHDVRRYAEETQASAGPLGALCPWGGNAGRLGPSERQPHCGPLGGAGETQLPSRCEHQRELCFCTECSTGFYWPYLKDATNKIALITISVWGPLYYKVRTTTFMK